MKQTITKAYSDIPFAHRQHTHAGHCAFIHGHNWTFTFEISGEPDELDFVIDFGGGCMKSIRTQLNDFFDHACLLNEADIVGQTLVAQFPALFKVRVVESCSAEGIARLLLKMFSGPIATATQGRAFLSRVIVLEDAKNSAEAKACDL